MAKTIEYIDNIEKLESFEEKFGIRLEGLSVKLNQECNSPHYVVSGDVFAANGTTIDKDIELVMSCHDAAGRVLAHTKHKIKATSFSGLDTFSVYLFYALLPFVGVKKVRIYPKLAQ